MREFITVDREANTIRLQRSAFKGTFILVEGSSDKDFYQLFTDKNESKLVTTSGKPSSKLKAIKILEILEQSGFTGILAIVDADFDRLENVRYPSLNLLYTDTHDLETMLIKSCALDKVITVFGSEAKIAKFQQHQDIRKTLLDAGLIIGYLFWGSQVKKLNLTFSKLEFSKFINHKNLQIDELKLIQEIKNKSQASSLPDEDLKQLLINKQNEKHDPWEICRGHDLVKILAIALRKLIGTNNKKEVEPDILERSLILAYEKAWFIKTEVYQDICTWEKNNQPFKVLNTFRSY